MINNINKNCTGCGACFSICPVKAIKMEFSENGFYVPVVDKNKCIKCGKCLKVCAALDYKSNNKEPQAYAIAAHDDERIHSTSGGAFAVLAKYVLKNNGYVCGVAWNKNWEAKHIIINRVEDLQKLRFSKYVQATTDNCFKKIKELLEDQKLVLFSGTPCQNAGLTKFLNKDYENLITIDILCHGTPSPKVWQDYLEQNYKKENINEINFRDKYKDWNIGTWEAIYNTNYGYIKENDEKKQIGIYYEAFLKHILSNDACMECKYKYIPRPADFTLGDFWYLRNNPKYDSQKGLNVLLVNNIKAKQIFKKVSSDFKICKKVNLNKKWSKIEITDVSRRNYAREEFFENYKKGKPLNCILKTAIGKKYDVALLTMCNVMNYGSALVAYAANQIINKLGYSILMINKDLNGFDNDNPKNRSLEFARKHYNLSKFYSKDDSCYELNEIVDKFVVCSDTMWWDTEYAKDYAYLDFVKSDKTKISFSTSFGHNNLTMDEESILRRKFLFKRFNSISTREVVGIKHLRETFNAEGIQLYDPTLIADKVIFDKISMDSTRKDTNFIFAYMLDLTPEKEKLVKFISKKLNKKFILISDMRYKGYSKIAEKENISIEDFVYLCKNADFIISDSFHGACFSVIYQKDFISLVNAWRGIARYKIFEDMGLKQYIYESIEDIYNISNFNFSIDYTLANNIIKNERIRAINWLKNALEQDEHVIDKSDLLYDYLNIQKIKVFTQEKQHIGNNLKLRKKIKKYKKLFYLLLGVSIFLFITLLIVR